ncbi:hypothetical protein SDC9_136426 [bioreactor metagenome]|uniref:Uncharacterized protein n=1 Tax=bioreactor metagenome TaxID=1076179 RepID=A0A645DJ78_9ZZZZ
MVRPRVSVIVVRIVFVPVIVSSFVEKELPEYVAPLTMVEIEETDDPYAPAADILTLSLLLRCTKQANWVVRSSSASEYHIEPVGTTVAGIVAVTLACVVPRRTPPEYVSQ